MKEKPPLSFPIYCMYFYSVRNVCNVLYIHVHILHVATITLLTYNIILMGVNNKMKNKKKYA